MSEDPVGRFDVRVQPVARRALAERLPEAVAAAVLDFLDGPLVARVTVLAQPRVGKPLVGPLAGCLGARRGTYRIVYRVDLDRRTVQVLDIDHRSTVYRRR